MRTPLKNKRKAFTLVEVMLAVGVMAIAISSMIGLLSAITANINQIRQQSKAVALISNIETTLKDKNFDTVYQWGAESHRAACDILLGRISKPGRSRQLEPRDSFFRARGHDVGDAAG